MNFHYLTKSFRIFCSIDAVAFFITSFTNTIAITATFPTMPLLSLLQLIITPTTYLNIKTQNSKEAGMFSNLKYMQKTTSQHR